jgi:hypothetical protein
MIVGIGVGGINVNVGGTRVKVGKNRNWVGVGSSGDNVDALPEISVMVGVTGVAEETAPELVAVTAPGNVGVPC